MGAHPTAEWEAKKPLIEQYYIHESMTLERTIGTMTRKHGFEASEKMYKTRIKKWNFQKYMKDADASLILLTEQTSGKPRSLTIGGRTFTEDHARRHIKRKKLNTHPSVPACQAPDTTIPLPMVFFEDQVISPVEDFTVSGFVFPRSCQTDYGTTTKDVVDIEMEDLSLSEGEGVVVPNPVPSNLVISPNLLLQHSLSHATESFLRSMQGFCDKILRSIPTEFNNSLSTRRFNDLWDQYSSKAVAEEQNQSGKALVIGRRAQSTFTNMLGKGDPWLLMSMCLLLNEHMSNTKRAPITSAFLQDMALWANTAQPNHPIADLIKFLGLTKDRGIELLEGMVRMLIERMRSTIGIDHDLSLELARLHSKILTDMGMHATAQTLLSDDLAGIAQKFGNSSLQNLLRLASLARCHFMEKDYLTSVELYESILEEPLATEPCLADIKYGAMYFVIKSNAELGKIDQAIDQAKVAIQFSLATKGSDHYWANNARELLTELEERKRRSFEFELIE